MRFIFSLVLLAACVQLDNPITELPATDTVWDVIADGLEQEMIRHQAVFFQTVRVDPEKYSFRAHYRPNAPLTIEQWHAELPDAAVIINANFFTADNTIVGLLISDGVTYGTSFRDRGGTFFVDDDTIGIRSNITEPYQGEAFNQAIQAFPMLLLNAQAAYNNNQDNAISRRTIIAQDTQGHIILMVTSGFGISLYNLSQFLATSDLGLVTALNLDGGGSSMMYIAPSDTTILSFDPVPAILAVYER